MLRYVLLPRSHHKLRQKSATNLGSRSEMSVCGTPKQRTTCVRKRCTTCAALKFPSPMKHGISIVYFVSRSTHVMIALKPPDRRRPVVKSIDQDVKRAGGIGRGWSKPFALVVASLVRMQTSHFPTNSATSARNLGHQTRSNNA